MSLPELRGVRGLVFIAAFSGMVTAATGAVLSLLAWPFVIRAVLPILLLVSAGIAYFIDSYGIVLDPTMVVSLVQTDVRETRDLLSLRLGVVLLVVGVAPSVWVLAQSRAPAQHVRLTR